MYRQRAEQTDDPVIKKGACLLTKIREAGTEDAMRKTFWARTVCLAILTIGTVSIGSAAAQTYDPAYPVCMHVYRLGANYYECRYTSLAQCNASASGRAAQCDINPYFASGRLPGGRQYRRVY